MKSFGVLHHTPDTALAVKDAPRSIKPEDFFLCYLYYSLENRLLYYRLIFKSVNLVRRVILSAPQPVKRVSATVIAGFVYSPLARITKLLAKLGRDVANFPLHHYAEMPFIMLANDALDCIGKSLIALYR